MSPKEVTDKYLEIRGCKIKRTYLNKKKAKEVAIEMTRKSDRGRLRAYSCNFCEGYHVGHIRPSYEDRKEAERIDKVLNQAT